MNPLSYCTDETIAIVDAADFMTVCPNDQCLANGSDGVLSYDGWALSSASTDFQASGLAPGNIVQVTGPESLVGFSAPQFAVDSTLGHLATLRQKGQATGIGAPVGPAGLTGVSFRSVTLGPQIARASRDLDQRFGIENILNGQVTVQLFDPTELEELTALFVLYRQFLTLGQIQIAGHRSTSKADQYKDEFSERLDRAVIHWKPIYTGQPSPASTRFGMRISR